MTQVNQTRIEADSVKVLVHESESEPDGISGYMHVTGNDVYLGRTQEEARRKQRYAPKDTTGPLDVEPRESVYAYNPGPDTAEIRRDQAGFWFTPDPRKVINIDEVAATIDAKIQDTVETNNYEYGDGFDYDGTAYPYTIDPAETIQFLQFTLTPDIEATVTTTSGDTATIPLAGGTGVIDWLSIDSVTLEDPKGTTGRVAGSWGGR